MGLNSNLSRPVEIHLKVTVRMPKGLHFFSEKNDNF